MIRVFHGFLGTPKDFAFLEAEGVVIHDLYKGEPETYPDDTLIGYSMGGRLAMELGRKNGFQKLILINAHPGLEDERERAIRSQWEQEVLARLSEPEKFLGWWNALALFLADEPLENVPPGSQELFKKMALSRQDNFLPFLEANKEKVHWVLGERDPKYSALSEKLKSFDVHYLPGGHRLFQHPEKLAALLQKILA